MPPWWQVLEHFRHPYISFGSRLPFSLPLSEWQNSYCLCLCLFVLSDYPLVLVRVFFEFYFALLVVSGHTFLQED
jgi:hypothetical protein